MLSVAVPVHPLPPPVWHNRQHFASAASPWLRSRGLPPPSPCAGSLHSPPASIVVRVSGISRQLSRAAGRCFFLQHIHPSHGLLFSPPPTPEPPCLPSHKLLPVFLAASFCPHVLVLLIVRIQVLISRSVLRLVFTHFHHCHFVFILYLSSINWVIFLPSDVLDLQIWPSAGFLLGHENQDQDALLCESSWEKYGKS